MDLWYGCGTAIPLGVWERVVRVESKTQKYLIPVCLCHPPSDFSLTGHQTLFSKRNARPHRLTSAC